MLARRRPPLLSAAVVALDWITFHAGLGRRGLQAAVYLAWSLILTGYLIAACARRQPEFAAHKPLS